MDTKTLYVTTPIYYVNDKPHIGHAYTTIAADIIARFHRLDGYDVKFLTGTDEHGQKVAKAAAAKNFTPQQYADDVSRVFRDLTKTVGASNDDFIRTTEPRHQKTAQALWKKMVDAGDIYAAKYGGWYAVRDEAYYDEKELTLDKDGQKIAPTGAVVEWVEEDSFYFRLSAWQDKLLKFYDDHPDFILPAGRRNEVVNFVKGGLMDLSISRTTFDWGIPVPDTTGHVMYVWVDALANYITELGYPDTSNDYAKFWPHSLHLIGKDILRFHAVYWPAFLMSAGLTPPERVFGHGWIINDGQKMSKSLGNVIAPQPLIDEFGLDAVRYFLFREVPFGLDGEYSRERMISRINGDLANAYGNLVQRVLSQIAKNCASKVPQPDVFTEADTTFLREVGNLLQTCREEMGSISIHKMLEAIWRVIYDANKYVDEQAPWELKKANITRMNTVLYVLAESIRQIAIVTQPVMPASSGKILDQLAISSDKRNFIDISASPLVPGLDLPQPFGVFPRFIEK